MSKCYYCDTDMKEFQFRCSSCLERQFSGGVPKRQIRKWRGGSITDSLINSESKEYRQKIEIKNLVEKGYVEFKKGNFSEASKCFEPPKEITEDIEMSIMSSLSYVLSDIIKSINFRISGLKLVFEGTFYPIGKALLEIDNYLAFDFYMFLSEKLKEAAATIKEKQAFLWNFSEEKRLKDLLNSKADQCFKQALYLKHKAIYGEPYAPKVLSRQEIENKLKQPFTEDKNLVKEWAVDIWKKKIYQIDNMCRYEEYDDAMESAQFTLNLAKDAFGPTSYRVAVCLDSIALIYYESGELENNMAYVAKLLIEVNEIRKKCGIKQLPIDMTLELCFKFTDYLRENYHDYLETQHNDFLKENNE